MSIDRKITAWTIGIILVVSLISAYLNVRSHIREEEAGFEALGNTLGPLVEASVEHSMMTRDYAVLERTLKNLSTVEPIERIRLIDNEGVVRAATDGRDVGGRLAPDDEHCNGCHATGRQGFTLETGGVYRWLHPLRNKPPCFGCHPSSQKHNGLFTIDFSVYQARALMRREIRNELMGFLPALALAGLGMLLLIRLIVIKRVNAIGEGLRRFTAGEAGVRIPVAGQDELARLGKGFNAMAETISSSQRELGQYADELLSLAVSSNVVTAVPRTENLHEAVCSLAVREMNLKMAWMGLVSRDSRDVQVVAQCGFEAGYLSSVRIAWDDSPAGRGPTGTAVKTRTPMVMNDMEHDPAYAPWRDEAMKRGYRSSMALPLLNTDGDVLGVLNLYSGEPAYFTRKRVRLFVIFANQVASAMENRTLIELEEQRNREIAEQLRQISRSHKEWQLTFDSITDFVSIHDRNYRIIKANKALARHLGLEQEALAGRKCHELFHATCVPLPACPHRTSMEENRVVVEEIMEPRTHRTLRISIFPYHSPEGEYIGSVHIARDITEEKEREMRLIMSERLASLGQMASGIAHEINNPLASIGGCAEGLLMKVKRAKYDPAQFEEYLTIIEEEVRRCKSITTGMLSFVRKTAYERKELDVNVLLDKTVEIIGFQGRFRDVEIMRAYQDGLPPLFGSEGELRQVFLAVMTNALDAMEDSGTLTVATAADEENVIIRIADTGPGISQEHLQRIFDPFFTTKSEKGGTGLGLSIAHKIVTNHEGSITVRSECGRGTEFTTVLPLETDRK